MKRRLSLLIVGLLLCAVALWATTAGPGFPTTTSGNTGAGTVTWTSPGNITASDGIFATAATNASTSQDLIGQGFGFSIPSGAVINGILLEISAKSATGSDANDLHVRLLKAGTPAGLDKGGLVTYSAANTVYSYGGSADLWGAAWAYTDLNSATFGGSLAVISGASDTASVDFFRITVTYTYSGMMRRQIRYGGMP